MTGPDPRRNSRILLGTAFTAAGIAHIIKHQWFEQLVPEPLSQWRKPISAVTAVIQLVGGISMFIPRLRIVARWTNLAMLVPTLPAAIDQTRHPDRMRELGVDPKLVVARIPAQMLVAALTWWATRPSTNGHQITARVHDLGARTDLHGACPSQQPRLCHRGRTHV